MVKGGSRKTWFKYEGYKWPGKLQPSKANCVDWYTCRSYRLSRMTGVPMAKCDNSTLALFKIDKTTWPVFKIDKWHSKQVTSDIGHFLTSTSDMGINDKRHRLIATKIFSNLGCIIGLWYQFFRAFGAHFSGRTCSCIFSFKFSICLTSELIHRITSTHMKLITTR